MHVFLPGFGFLCGHRVTDTSPEYHNRTMKRETCINQFLSLKGRDGYAEHFCRLGNRLLHRQYAVFREHVHRMNFFLRMHAYRRHADLCDDFFDTIVHDCINGCSRSK